MTDLNAVLSKAFQSHQAGDLAAAAAGYRKVLQQHPQHWSTRTLLATTDLQQGNYAAAADGFRASLQLNNAQPDAWLNQGNALRELGDLQGALAACEQCVAIAPDFAQAWSNRGNLLTALRQYPAAIESHQRAVTLVPDDADGHANLAAALWEAREFAPALTACDAAIRLAPQAAGPWQTRGHVLRGLNQYDAALQSYAAALTRQDTDPALWLSHGNALCDLGRHAEGLASYQRALALKPDDADVHWAIALTQLQLGHFAEGWQRYEARLQLGQRAVEQARFAVPRWDGLQPLAGKRIVLHTEQGFGDAIQFCRYALLLAERGAHVTLEVKSPLATLMRSLPARINVVVQEEASFADHDYHCPLMSLPLALGTTLETIPAAIPYLQASAPNQAVWAARLGERPDKTRRVGLVWSGSPTHKDDYARSIPLSQLGALLALPGVEFHCLQDRVRDADGAATSQLPLHNHAGELSDFDDTAALIAGMDLVISVDTAVAHLAGAMGKPVWVLLPVAPDFRWLLARDDSPWYPAARLFRQPAPGDWQSVITDVVQALHAWRAQPA
ncbi:tetratricopeptide repeat protein [Andreprevotia sp. IGB-42]|uniref:tetratricopeptide repeat protein n=1 Tax=Andreprevotia sp. IGB-42 TaxID=2497473 RepID=UPI00135773B1|nr:tetratricopeptide repeat protein [Andreprevotia sp. IGB-42]